MEGLNNSEQKSIVQKVLSSESSRWPINLVNSEIVVAIGIQSFDSFFHDLCKMAFLWLVTLKKHKQQQLK